VELAAGDLDAALDLAHEATSVSATVASDLDRGHAHQSLGYAAAARGLWEEAEAAFVAGQELFTGLDLPALVRECVTGQAGAVAGRGDLAAAVTMLEPVLGHLDVARLSGTTMPGDMLLTCHRLLAEAGDARAEAVLDAARTYLRTMAEEVGDPDLAAGYLALRPHVALMSAG
jgi:hypothetical protein